MNHLRIYKQCFVTAQQKLSLLTFLVGGFNPTPLKNMSLSKGISVPNIWKKIRCSKPPTRFVRPIHNSKRLIDPTRFPVFGGLFYGLHLLHLILMWDGESRSSWKHDLSKMDHHIILNIQLNPPIRSNKIQ